MSTPIIPLGDLYQACPQKEEMRTDLTEMDTQFRLLIQSTTLLSHKFGDRALMEKVVNLPALVTDGEDLIKLVENARIDLDRIKRNTDRFFSELGWSVDRYTKSFAHAESYGKWHDNWRANIAPLVDRIADVISQAERKLGESK